MGAEGVGCTATQAPLPRCWGALEAELLVGELGAEEVPGGGEEAGDVEQRVARWAWQNFTKHDRTASTSHRNRHPFEAQRQEHCPVIYI